MNYIVLDSLKTEQKINFWIITFSFFDIMRFTPFLALSLVFFFANFIYLAIITLIIGIVINLPCNISKTDRVYKIILLVIMFLFTKKKMAFRKERLE